MNSSPGQLSVIAIFSLVLVLGTVYALDTIGIISSPLSLENEIGTLQGSNTSDPGSLFAKSYIETKLQFADSIKSSRTDSSINIFQPFSLISATDKELNPLIRAELFIYTDFAKMGSNVEFDFPRSTVKQFVTVNGIPVNNVPKQLLLENTYNTNTKLLKGAGLAITPDFFEQIIQNSKPLVSGDIIELIMTVDARYDVRTLDNSGHVLRYYDGFIKGLNTSVVFVYYEPTELLLLRAGESTEIPTNIHLSGCVDDNFNGICDSNDSTVVEATIIDSNTGSTSTSTSSEPVPEGQITSGSAGGSIFDVVPLPEEPIVDPNTGDLTSIFTNEDLVDGTPGSSIVIDIEELEPGVTSEQSAITIFNGIESSKQTSENSIYVYALMGGLVAIGVIYFVLKKVRN